MKGTLDEFHKAILDFLEKHNGGKDIGLRQIAEYAKLNHPQKALNKIRQLEKMWYIRKNNEEERYELFRKNPIPEFMIIPVYSLEQFERRWRNIQETEPIRRVKIPSDILGISWNDDYFFIKAKGKALLPIIKPDDLVLIKKEKEFVEWKKYLVIHNNIPKIKILQKIWEEKWLISTNFSFDKEQPLTLKDDINVLWAAQKVITSV